VETLMILVRLWPRSTKARFLNFFCGAVTEWSKSRQNLSSVWKNWLSHKF